MGQCPEKLDQQSQRTDALLHLFRAWTKLNLTILAGLVSEVGFPLFAGDQPQWGQAWSRNMVCEERGLADSFEPATGRNIKWVARLGSETHSSPMVANGRVYIGTNNSEPRDPKHQGD